MWPKLLYLLLFINLLPLKVQSKECSSLVSKLLARESNESRYLKYKSFEQPALFAKEAMLLEKKINGWAEMAERSIKIRELRRINVARLLKESLEIDDHLQTASLFRSLFIEVEQNYYLGFHHKETLKDLVSLKEIFRSHGRNQLFEETLTKAQEKNPQLLKNVLWESEENVLASIEKEIIHFEDKRLDAVYSMAKRLDEYVEVRTYLELVQNNQENQTLRNKASKILYKLQSHFALDTYSHLSGEQISTPEIKKLREIVSEEPMMIIRLLRKELHEERLSALFSRTPDFLLHKIVDKTVSLIPLINRPQVRTFLRSVIDYRQQMAYYPSIDRLLESTTDITKKLEFFRIKNASHPGDEFMITMARRSDAKDEWSRLLEQAKELSTKAEQVGKDKFDRDRDFYKRMQSAEKEARKRGDLPAWHIPQMAHALRFVVDTLFIGVTGYTSYYFLEKLWPDSPEQSSVPSDSVEGQGPKQDIDEGTIRKIVDRVLSEENQQSSSQEESFNEQH